jgi:hypothetical protein
VRGLTRKVGAQAGLLAVSDETGQVVEVPGTWGSVLGLDDLPASLIDGSWVARSRSSARPSSRLPPRQPSAVVLR